MQFENFIYKDGKLFCEEVNIEQVAETIGTPFYLYSKKSLVDNFNEFKKAFGDIDNKIFYAVKANSNLNVIKLFYSLGAGLDVNSAGEMHRALKIGAKPNDILFTGVGKTKEEILLGLQNDIFLFKAESIQEIELMNSLAKEQNKKARIAIRVNPNVNPNTHPYITTGLYESKFGIDEKSAIDAFKFAASLSNIQIVGIDIHIGSQITDISAYFDAVEIILKLINELRANSIEITHFDIGG
ncbi:MAG: diaminopimelate decarboxylase, partial [Ignavibacteria bacterium]|nr:diaminopimelate decarboxylase [Ignavibacteria bacterium]